MLAVARRDAPGDLHSPAGQVGRPLPLRVARMGRHALVSLLRPRPPRPPPRRRAGQPPRLFLTAARSHFHAWQHGGQLQRLTGELPLPRLAECGDVQVLTKPCHGLVLLRCNKYYGHYVCNSSTGAVLPLPDSRIPARTRRRETYDMRYSYGLGHSAATNEYKAVRVFSCKGYHNTTTIGCEVFSLDVSPHWRPAAGKPLPFCVVQWKAGVFANGCLHFLREEGGSIVTFNVGDESFGSLALPSGLDDVGMGQVELTVLGGSLCIHYYRHASISRGFPYYIWLLKDYDEQKWEELCIRTDCWSDADRRLLVSMNLTALEVYRGGDGRDKIMFATVDCEVFAVDLDGGSAPPEILFSPDDGTMTDQYSGCHPVVGLLEESLVSVGRTNQDIIFSSPRLKAWSDVLKWLPTRTVARLNLVCRDWRALISTDRFMQLHAAHANLHRSPRIMFVQPLGRSIYSMEGYVPRLAYQHPLFLNEIVVCSGKPCHGLLAGSYTNTAVRYKNWDFICNPAMPSSFKTLYRDEDDCCTSFAGRIGLGYDSATNRHVLVRLFYRNKHMKTREYRLECKIHHADTSSWISIDPPPRPVADMPPAYANGKLNWMVDYALGPILPSRCEILALDVATLKFEVLQGPPCYVHRSMPMSMSILELRGHLCVHCSNSSTRSIDVWIMEGISGAWSKGYHIELGRFSHDYPAEKATPLAVDPRDGRVFSTGRVFGYYDPRTTELEIVYNLGDHKRFDDCRLAPVLCQESLVLPYLHMPDHVVNYGGCF